MKLIECYIENFGAISKQKFEFSSGLTCFLAENGAGKTTLSVFIKAMLYGLGENKKSSLFENERKRYLPWGGGVCGGTLTFLAGGKKYRAERTFAQKPADDTYALYDLATGLICSDFQSVLGEEIFEIDADGFERTVFLSERALSVENENKSISAKISDLVGVDGDIGVMDIAKKRLDAQRKFLNKKGGSGRISEIKAEISAVELELSEIYNSRRKRTVAEAELEGYKKRLAELESEQERLNAERTNALMLSAEEKQREHIEGIKKSVADEVKRKDELLEFFGGDIPSAEELEDKRYKSIRAEELSKLGEGSAEESEYSELVTYFAGRADDKDILEVRAAYETLREDGRESPSGRTALLFSKRLPSAEEIDANINALNAAPKSSPTRPIISGLLSLGAVAFAVLGVIVSPVFYALAAILIISAPVPLLLSFSEKRVAKAKARESADEFIRSVCDIPLTESTRLEILIEMKSRYELRREVLSHREECDAVIDDFLSKFGFSHTDSDAFLSEILAKHDRLKALSHSASYKSAERGAAMLEREKLLEECKVFLSKYKAKTANPFDEIRCALIEYQRLSDSIISKRQELLSYDKSSADKSVREVRSLEIINEDIARTAAETRELVAKIGMQSKSILDEGAFIEREDELVARRAELLEELSREQDRLEIILKTEKYLEAAKISLTSKYLGKTRERFERYARIISGIDGTQYEMNTNFGVSVYEMGATRASDAYSRGTRDLYSLAARLALSDSLYEGELPFIVLDDPFISFDDKRTEAATKLLCEISKERQVIYFTCSESRRI